jgi:ketosteroid isomerase-like protein
MRFGFGVFVLGAALVAASPGLADEPSPLSVVKQRFEAFARRDVDAIAALYAADAVETSPGFCTARHGQDGARKTYGDLFKTFPGIQDDVTAYVVDGNHVAVQFTARVAKADGTTLFAAPLANFLTVEHGKITRDETYFDTRGQPCA